MGQKIDLDDPVLGDNCSTFPVPAETPKTIYVYFWGIIPCPGPIVQPPNGHVFALAQDDVFPCLWKYDNVDFGFKVTLDISTITPIGIELRNQANELYFEGELWGIPPAEHIWWANLWEICGPNIAHHGFATIYWLDAAVALLNDMNLPADEQVMLEFFVTDDKSPVYKFCSPSYSMNVKFLVSP